jgi:sec-independent protein translocase protein TatB
MFDIGVTKLAIVGGIALIVIGPERLPRVARLVGTMLGRAQRYVADVKAEVNRSIELEELAKMKTHFEAAAREVQDTVNQHVQGVRASIEDRAPALGDGFADEAAAMRPVPVYKPPRKNWRIKRAAIPTWYKQRAGVRTHAQSGAARVARFRPAGRTRLP